MEMNEKKKVVNLDMKQYGMFLALIAIYVIFAIMTGGKNLSPANINNLIMQNGYVVILAIGMLLCVLTGNVDLGVGSVVALTGAAAGIILIDYKMNMWIAILVALLIGLLYRLSGYPAFRCNACYHVDGARTYIYASESADKRSPPG